MPLAQRFRAERRLRLAIMFGSIFLSVLIAPLLRGEPPARFVVSTRVTRSGGAHARCDSTESGRAAQDWGLRRPNRATLGIRDAATTGLSASASGVSRLQFRSTPIWRRLGSYWLCSRGYRQSGDRCVAIDVPDNAHLTDFVFSRGWECDVGYREDGDSCVRISAPPMAIPTTPPTAGLDLSVWISPQRRSL